MYAAVFPQAWSFHLPSPVPAEAPYIAPQSYEAKRSKTSSENDSQPSQGQMERSSYLACARIVCTANSAQAAVGQQSEQTKRKTGLRKCVLGSPECQLL